MPKPASNSLVAITRLIAALSIIVVTNGCATQQKLFGKPSSDWQQAYQSNAASAAEESSADKATTPPITNLNTAYYLQPVAYSSRDNAERQLKKIKTSIKHPVMIFEEEDNGTLFYKIQIGPFPSLQAAAAAERDVLAAGFEKVRYVRR